MQGKIEQREAINMKHEQIKRGADCVLASAGLVLLLPILAGSAVLCATAGEGIFYRQERIGRYGVPFQICKFRTMRRNTPILPHAKLTDPARYCIPGGAFLRSTGIDELPQLWNVLKGEMSLIGPRPLLPTEGGIHRMRERSGVYALRPGITGLSQLCGDLPATVKSKIDGIYWENRSILLDCAIIWGTLALLARRQAEKGSSTVAGIAKILLNIYKSTCILSQNVVS